MDRDVDVLRQQATVLQRMRSLQVEKAGEDPRFTVGTFGLRTFVQHRVEAGRAPLRRRLGILEQPCRRSFQQPLGVVHLRLGPAAVNPLGRAQLELTRRVVAAVAHDAARRHDRLDLGPVVDRAGRERLHRSRNRSGFAITTIESDRSDEGAGTDEGDS